MKYDSIDESFIDGVKRTVSNRKTSCYPCLIRSMNGCFPTTLVSVLAELEVEDQTCEWHDKVRGWDVPLHTGFFPHILDSDWRYSKPSVARLLDLALRQSGLGSSFIHIGSPSTYKEALRSFPNIGRHWLFDKNALRHQAEQSLSIQGDESVDFAIIDPPWYPEESRLFVNVARDYLKPGALVFMVQPAQLTRPGVLKERMSLLQNLALDGFAYIATRPDFVRYETPHFEWVTLQRQLDSLVPADWRLGDLIILRYASNSRSSESNSFHFDSQPTEDLWAEESLGPMRIKIRRAPSANRTTFQPIGDLGMCQNVSRRDPLFREVGIWTTGNRVFYSRDMLQAQEIVSELRQLAIRVSLNERSCAAALKKSGMNAYLADSTAKIIIEDIMEHFEHAAV